MASSFPNIEFCFFSSVTLGYGSFDKPGSVGKAFFSTFIFLSFFEFNSSAALCS